MRLSRLLLLVCCAAPLAAAPAPPPSTYPPDREAALLHLALEIQPDFDQRTLNGTATLRFKALDRAFDTLRLDALDLSVTNVTATRKLAGWQATATEVVIALAAPVPAGSQAVVTIYYHAAPKQGLYFRTPAQGYPAGETHLFSQGESQLARHWYPCYDAPSDKHTTEVSCRVPEGMAVLSNGRQISDTRSGGFRTVKWAQEQPHANYLVSLVAGYFDKIQERHGNIPMAFWALPSQLRYASNSFRHTGPAMTFLEEETGLPYPWARYDQVCVMDFVAGGMENTTQTTLTDQTLHGPEFENLRSSQLLVAHELAHQWFGDWVTCKDWSHLWINEGFATYYEALYDGRVNGPDTLAWRMWSTRETLASNPGETNSIVHRRFKSPNDQFNGLNYGKAAWVLHMLRAQLGQPLFQRCVSAFLQRHARGSAVTSDFSSIVEELSGRSFAQFFDQWLYQPGLPQLEASYTWDEQARLARLSIRQTQPEFQPVFRFPLPVRFESKSGATNCQVLVSQRSEEFTFALPRQPQIVRLDPGVTVLAKIQFPLPEAMLRAQLAPGGDLSGRLAAVEGLNGRADPETVALLAAVLNGDPFHAVRAAASKALRSIHTAEAFDALLASTAQPDARVRRQLVSDLAGFYRQPVLARLLQIIDQEKNPDIAAEAVRGLGAYPGPQTRPVLERLLGSASFNNVLGDAAIAAMRAQDAPEWAAPIMDALRQRPREFTARGFGAGLGAVAWLSRAQDNRQAVREFLAGYVNDPRLQARLGALSALGVLNDPRAGALLQTFIAGVREGPERAAAERAAEALRAARPAAGEIPGASTLRKEIQDLQRENRALKESLDGLKKKVDALRPEPQSKQAGRPPGAPVRSSGPKAPGR